MDGIVLKPNKEDLVVPEQAGPPSEPTAAVPIPVSPLKASEAYENLCGICFTEIHPADNPRGRLNSCNHLFCSYCIKEWAKNTNVCPSCKARFTRIYTFNPGTQSEEETKVRRRNYKAWELSYYSDEDEDEEEREDSAALRGTNSQEGRVVCDVCQQSQNAARMIFCDRRQCPYTAHLDCLGLVERPITFLCPQCTQLREQECNAAGASAAATSSSVAEPPLSVTPFAAATAPAQSPTTRSSPRGAFSTTPKVVAVAAAVRANCPTVTNISDTLHARQSAAPQVGSRAPYGGGRSDSGTGSSRSPSSSTTTALPSRHTVRPSLSQTSAPPVIVPRQPIDFSKPHIPTLPSPVAPIRGSRGYRTPANDAATTIDHKAVNATNADGVEDDYYFLSPTSHAVAATIELAKMRANRAAEAQARRQHERTKAERLESIYGVSRSHINFQSGCKRPQRTVAEELSLELDSAEKEFTDLQMRRAMEERMVRRWAAEILPVLRRRRYIEGDTATSEADMWMQAVAQARKMVREKLDAKGASLRRRREQLVRAQANRESAALAKLARIIAQHREREQQNRPRASEKQS